MGQRDLNSNCLLDDHNMTTSLCQELVLGVGLEADVVFDLTKLSPDAKNEQWPALVALADRASLLRTATTTTFLDTTISQTIGCLETVAPASPTNSSSTNSSSPTITSAPTTTPLPTTLSLPPSTTAMIAQAKPNSAVSGVVVDVCAGVLIVIAAVFLSL
jgi:hypothetical protein